MAQCYACSISYALECNALTERICVVSNQIDLAFALLMLLYLTARWRPLVAHRIMKADASPVSGADVFMKKRKVVLSALLYIAMLEVAARSALLGLAPVSAAVARAGEFLFMIFALGSVAVYALVFYIILLLTPRRGPLTHLPHAGRTAAALYVTLHALALAIYLSGLPAEAVMIYYSVLLAFLLALLLGMLVVTFLLGRTVWWAAGNSATSRSVIAQLASHVLLIAGMLILLLCASVNREAGAALIPQLVIFLYTGYTALCAFTVAHL